MPKVKEVKSALLKAVNDGMLPHAVLFDGEKGTGKTETALWLSKLLLCTGDNPPCGICGQCRKTESGNHPDVTVIAPEGKKTSIGIDDIRKIKDGLYLSPSEGKRKIYIIPSADTMTIEAQNAFLKSLEEPPRDVSFILTCSNRDFLLDTIVSRTSVYSFSPMTADECTEELIKKHPDIDERTVYLVSLAFDGSFGAAESAILNGEGEMAKSAADIPSLLRKGKLYDVNLLVSSFAKDRNELGHFLDVYRNILLKSSVEKSAGRRYEVNIKPYEAVKIGDIVSRGKDAILQNGSNELIISWFVLECAKVFGGN